ncbi:restriction endonuclease subunit S [Bacterioplanoides sp. SCSIO 12839]|uniref:restriction endonuclease subunit S n=1 Tax=Bacterioplanoides sp. SCSIO 12839 TaxID=2829569 RepID=UPI0021077847|nr:restriction endonuclease subunit S [Bacterioplanoides sp. SCSIO 12839]UTW49407.1 restriction endonuclease subunit S [Bacterioplanoides sp. SCSIO 12839]
MSNWVTKPLGELITLQRGHDLPSQDRKAGSVPIMGSSGITGYHDEVKTRGPGVVIGRSGNSMGEVSFSPVDFWPLNTCLYVTDFKGNDERYIYYLLQTINFDQFNSGSAQKSLNRNAVYPYEVKTTECKDEQVRIARNLAALEDKIELNRQTNQTLENIAQVIFKSWFVDFEPTRAKIAAKEAGQDPERAAMAAISGKPIEELDQLSAEQQEQLKATAALFPDALVDSELGEIPEGWEAKPLSQMVNLIGGGTPKKSEATYWGGEIPWFSVKDAPDDGDVFVIDTELKITELGLNKSSTKLLPEGTTIISARGTVGRLALVGVPTAMNQSCYGVQGVDGIGPYLNYFNVKEAVSTLKQNTHGAVFDTITRETFDTVILVQAKGDVLVKFEEVVKSNLNSIKNNLFESKALEEARDSLLPKLLSGEIALEPINES